MSRRLIVLLVCALVVSPAEGGVIALAPGVNPGDVWMFDTATRVLAAGDVALVLAGAPPPAGDANVGVGVAFYSEPAEQNCVSATSRAPWSRSS